MCRVTYFWLCALPSIITFCGIPTMSIAAAARPEETASPTIARAQELQQAARQLLDDRKYGPAEAAYRTALDAWTEAVKQHPDDREVQLERDRCENDYAYTVSRPIRKAQDEARQLAKKGRVPEAAKSFMAVARQYRNAYRRTGLETFQKNWIGCLNDAGLVPIRAADALVKEKKYARAVEWYQCGIERLQEADGEADSPLFANNMKYARQRLATARFADVVAAHRELPDFELPSFAGGTARLSQFRGRPTLLVVWAAWCGTCRETLPAMEIVQLRARVAELAVVGLNVDQVEGWDRDAANRAEQLVADILSFPNVWATAEVLERLGNPQSVPTLIWLDAAGRVVKVVDNDHRSVRDLMADWKTIAQADNNDGAGQATVRP